MAFISVFLIAVSLAMDAFATNVSYGICLKESKAIHALTSSAFFGLFQGFMPFIGWLLGYSFSGIIKSVDHWIAFVLLAIIGINMIRETLGDDEEACTFTKFNIKTLLFMAVATSIDALIVGVTFAFEDSFSTLTTALPVFLIIAVVTFVISFAGFYIGKFFGGVCKKSAGIIGGAILILMGLKTLLEHLEILSF